LMLGPWTVPLKPGIVEGVVTLWVRKWHEIWWGFHNFNLLAFEEKARRSKRNELLRCFCVISLVVYCKNSIVAWWAWGPKAAIFFKFISPNCLLGSWIEIIISIQKKKLHLKVYDYKQFIPNYPTFPSNNSNLLSSWV